MRVLVTGLKGFTGRYLKAELINHGHEVVGLKADLTEAQALAEEVRYVHPDWVVHLAGIAFVGHGEPNDFYRINLLGTRNLLEALAQCSSRPSCVVLASSANVYGNRAAGLLRETDVPSPANDYAVSKLGMEYMARLWFDRLPIVVTRPFNYTGVGQSESFLIPKIVNHFRQRMPVIELGNVDVWRDFSDVRVVAQIYRRLLEACPSGETVNICSGHAVSLRQVLTMMSAIAGYEIEIRVNPAFVRTNEVKTLCGDTTKLQNIIGPWSQPSLHETLRWMYEAV